jgi:hypothetical protein
MSRSVLILPLFAALSVAAIAQTAPSKSPSAPVDLYAHTLENRVYTNPALGVKVTFPDGLDFVDTEVLRKKDAEDEEKYRQSLSKKVRPEMIQIVRSGGDPDVGIMFTVTSNLFVAQNKGPQGLMIYLKTQPGGVSFGAASNSGNSASEYFQDNEFFKSKSVKFLASPAMVTVNGNNLSQADMRIKEQGGKTIFSRIAVVYLANPHSGVGQYAVFEFVSESSIEEAQHASQMLQTLQLTAPPAALFPAK